MMWQCALPSKVGAAALLVRIYISKGQFITT